MTPAETERAKIVAWLRNWGKTLLSSGHLTAQEGRTEATNYLLGRVYILRESATAIARGDHEGIEI